MSEPYLGEIKITGFSFAPRGWALCDGQELPISQNQALWALLGTTYGGDGETTFALPDLRGRAPMHEGNGHALGSSTGEQTHALGLNEIPGHTHMLRASTNAGSTPVPTGSALGAVNNLYGPATDLVTLRSETIGTAGASAGHENMQPFLTLSFCIALQGIFPS